MPLFEFHCKACASKFEALVLTRSGEAEAILCPMCGAAEIQQEISAFHVRKGAPTREKQPGAALPAPQREKAEEVKHQCGPSCAQHGRRAEKLIQKKFGK